ncbi:MAG TPA: hypothetical protein VER79_06120 [Candidatus Limnocylindrales bacterium]|nr:hypothetical protein [Candidatus Limnocylindrales bacterium]
MLDDLRKGTGEGGYQEADDFTFPAFQEEVVSERKFLGMSAVERMFLSIFIFLNVVVIGLALLIFTGRLVL